MSQVKEKPSILEKSKQILHKKAKNFPESYSVHTRLY